MENTMVIMSLSLSSSLLSSSSSRTSTKQVTTVQQTSALLMLMCLIFCCCCATTTTTNAMVVVITPAPAVRMTATNKAASSSSSSSSDALIRKLINQQVVVGNKGSPSSYTFDPFDPANGNDNDSTHHKEVKSKANGVTTTSPPTTTKMQQQQTSSLLDEYREYEILRESNLENDILEKFFFNSGLQRKLVIANRFIQVLTTLQKARNEWSNGNSKFVVYDEVKLEASTQDDPAAVRLCEAVASLGPLAVKLGQTLSQRPDIVGKPACDALKRLQTQNTPFSNDKAYACIRESLNYWNNPLATNIIDDDNGNGNDNDKQKQNKQPLFQYLSIDPIASASLGQVYKATTFNGNDIAIKVQRPDALSIIAIDVQCFRIVFNLRSIYIDITEKYFNNIKSIFSSSDSSTSSSSSSSSSSVIHTPETGMTEDEVRAQGDEGTVSDVINRVARDIKRELDYNIEASNSYKFKDSLQFLGFVDTPDVVLATNKILMTSFIDGHHLSNLNNTHQKIALTRMAVEACTASMVLTGFVHADPHEGNLMYRPSDQKIVFLDFGLMSDVKQDIMEAFARGIQALLSEDFSVLTEAFIDTNFITSPIMYRSDPKELWKTLPPPSDKGLSSQEQLAIELEIAMKTTDGGLSRFGSLATVLNKKISPNWLVFTPPYVLLLVRTFLTLEGIAAQVDPDFNIYEMSLPWVVRRSLSPTTDKGINLLRNTILQSNNKIQWERLLDLTNSMSQSESAVQEDETAVAETVENSITTSVTTSPSDSSSPVVVTASKNGTPATTPTATTSVSSNASSSNTDTATTVDVVVADSSSSENTVTATAAMPSSQQEGEDHEHDKEQKQKEYAASRNAAMKDAVGTLLGSTEGKALRSVLKDLDTPDLIWKLGSIEGRPILKMATSKVVNTLFSSSSRSSIKKNKKIGAVDEEDEVDSNYRPISDECKELRERQMQRTKLVTRILVKKQLKSCLFNFKGIIGMSRLLLGMIQITTSILIQKIIRTLLLTTTSSKRRRQTKSPLF